MYFPDLRLRRLRKSSQLRKLVRENDLSVADLIYPLFIVEGLKGRNEVSSMPGVDQLGLDECLEEVRVLQELGIPGVILFGIPEHKDEMAFHAYAEDGIIQKAVELIKKETPDLLVITDVCLCEYMSHGHCGVVKGNEVLNDPTLELLAKTAVSHAQAGADIVAPSDMMDGRVAAIREGLDKKGFQDTPILSYAAKYASAFYGPFREAAESMPQFGDRRSYQMDPPNILEALREVQMDIEEGADMVMVKPALAYLDVIRAVKSEFGYPTAAYNVSGEYAMVKAAAMNGWIDERNVVLETLTAMKRAGADFILSYHAKDAARWLNK